MKSVPGYLLALVVLVIVGCAAPRLPAFVTAPDPPMEWKTFVENKVGCPDITGEYELIPEVADLQKDGLWRVSDGDWYDFLLLIPFSRVTADELNPDEDPHEYSRFSLFFESNDKRDMLRIISPDKKSEYFSIHTFREADDDFTCEAGYLIFPEFHVQGGAEGGYLNGKTYRQATITSSGDLLFYEQVQSHKVLHTYYLFKMKNNADTAG